MKDIEVGKFCGITINIKPEALLQIAARQDLNDHMKRIIEDNNKLVYKLSLTIEALNKILNRATTESKSGLSDYARRVCQNVLKKVE